MNEKRSQGTRERTAVAALPLTRFLLQGLGTVVSPLATLPVLPGSSRRTAVQEERNTSHNI